MRIDEQGRVELLLEYVQVAMVGRIFDVGLKKSQNILYRLGLGLIVVNGLNY